MPATLRKNGDQLEIDLSTCSRGSEFGDALAKIREIPGRRYDGQRKVWAVPAEPTIGDRVIQSIQPKVDDDLRSWISEGLEADQQSITTPLPHDADLLIPWATERAEWQPSDIRIGDTVEEFKGLMRHQRPLVDKAATVRKLVIADDMGLGKTGSAISAVEEWRLRAKAGGEIPSGPRLVVCPNSVKGSWARQLEMWYGPDVNYKIVDGSTASARMRQIESVTDYPEENGWLIVNWEQIRAKKVKKTIKRRNGSTSTKMVEEMKEPIFEKTEWLAVIADEVHRAKNKASQQTRGLWRVRADDGIMLAMSGTPMLNSPDELWSILHWLWPKEYTSYWRFYEEYVDYTEGYFGKVITGVRNPAALRFELRDRLVRRTQGEVLDLPGKVRVPVPLTLNKSQRKLYDDAENQMWLEIEKAAEAGDKSAEEFIAKASEGASMTELLQIKNGASRTVRLRQIIETPALLGADDDSAVLDSCVETIMDSGEEQWVVFTEFADTPSILAGRLRARGIEAVEYTGSVSTQDRADIEERFQRGEIQVVVGTLKSMYQGITLTAAHLEYFVSRDWVPDINEQAEDRCSRIGQKKRVVVYIAQPEDTVATSKVEPLNRLKERIVRAVLVKDKIESEETNG